jgi:hypothetical protein
MQIILRRQRLLMGFSNVPCVVLAVMATAALESPPVES